MTHATLHAATTPLPARMAQRLAVLGIPAISVVPAQPHPALHPLTDLSWLHRALLSEPPLAAALDQALSQETQTPPQPLQVWPGVWLAPLHAGASTARRRTAPPQPWQAAMLVTPAFLASDQFHLLCQHARLDVEAARRSVDHLTLVDDREAPRLAQTLCWLHADGVDHLRHEGELHGLSTELSTAYEELSLMYKLASSLTVDQPPQKTYLDACRELQLVSGIRWVALQLSEQDERMGDMAGEVFTAGEPSVGSDVLRAAGRQLMAMAGTNGTAVIIDDTSAASFPALCDVSRSLIAVPIGDQGQFGVLFGGDKADGSQITTVEGKLFSGLANSVSIYIENLLLYEDMQAMFYGTLHALTTAIDAKDRYTHGHSERVAVMARHLARAAGLSAQEIERVYIAGLIHDVGKIGVPEAVLTKPGSLTDEEFALIKMHPTIGARIMQDIRQMADLVPGVLYHHERWDGRGYPHGRAGADIPLFGRLICLADSFDAMSSNRNYRDGLPHDQVINEIRRCAGSQFDPQLASLFVQLDFAPYFLMIQHHQATAAVRQSA